MTEPNICTACEEEVDCDYVKDKIMEHCCKCDDQPQQERCASCFSDYASNVYDEVKARKERELL